MFPQNPAQGLGQNRGLINLLNGWMVQIRPWAQAHKGRRCGLRLPKQRALCETRGSEQKAASHVPVNTVPRNTVPRNRRDRTGSGGSCVTRLAFLILGFLTRRRGRGIIILTCLGN